MSHSEKPTLAERLAHFARSLDPERWLADAATPLSNQVAGIPKLQRRKIAVRYTPPTVDDVGRLEFVIGTHSVVAYFAEASCLSFSVSDKMKNFLPPLRDTTVASEEAFHDHLLKVLTHLAIEHT